MAEGLGEGWDDKFRYVRDEIDKSLDFDGPSMSINASVRKIGAEATGISRSQARGGNARKNVRSQIRFNCVTKSYVYIMRRKQHEL